MLALSPEQMDSAILALQSEIQIFGTILPTCNGILKELKLLLLTTEQPKLEKLT